MRTYIADVDVRDAQPRLWGTRGYGAARILVRSGARVLGELAFPLDPKWPAVPEQVLSTHLAEMRLLVPEPEDKITARLPGISVVVCTRDRPVQLRRCLAHLAAVSYARLEVIVVDNASTGPQTRDIVAQTPFRYVEERTPGLDWARNRGCQEARHEIVAYIDDDALADQHWLEGLARGFGDPDTGAVTGLTLPAELETASQHLFETYGGMSKGFRSRRFRAESLTRLQLLRAHDVGVGTNMAFRREVLEALGGFDTALDVGTPSCGGGDLDMFHRVLAAGHDIMYEPSALVRHQHRRDWRGLRQQIRNNGRSYGVYLLKRLRDAQLPRRSVLWFGIWHWGRWVAGRPIRGLLGRQRLPLRLLADELAGALSAPAAFVQTYRRDRQVRANRS